MTNDLPESIMVAFPVNEYFAANEDLQVSSSSIPSCWCCHEEKDKVTFKLNEGLIICKVVKLINV